MLVDLPREAVLRPGFWRISPAVPVRKRPGRAVREIGERPKGLWVDALMALTNSGEATLGYDDWMRVIFAIHHETGGSDEGLALAHEFSARSSKHDPAFLDERVWPYVRDREGGGSVTGGTVMSLAARLHGWSAPLDVDAFQVVGSGKKGASDGRIAGSVLDGRGGGAAGGGARDGMAGGVGAGLVGAAAHPTRDGGGPAVAACGEDPAADRSSGAGAGGGGVSLAGQAGGHDLEDLLEPVEREGIPPAKHLCTDQANAVRLVKAYGARVLVAGGRWHVWDGRRWAADEAGVYRFACQLSVIVKEEAAALVARARKAVEEDGNAERVARAQGVAEALEKWSVKCEMKGTIEAAIGLARKMLTVDAELLDRDPWLLNCRNGVVDLRDGSLRGHRADDLMTRLVDVDYMPGSALGGAPGGEGHGAVEAGVRVWEQVLAQIVPDESVRAFLQRWFGYCLTGWVREQAFVVHWGDGGNGKSTVLDLMVRTMGDYAGVAAPGLVAGADKSERHPTEIAALKGRRMVTAHESREGVALREDFIKQATGDDRLVARFMREDFFEFSPTHKIQLLTNHKPVIKGQDGGIWRRVLLVEYGVVFGDEAAVREGRATAVRDMRVGEWLGREEVLQGVLAWRVRGAVAWAREGLRPPDVVLDASARYRGGFDRIRQFVDECCEVAPAGSREWEAWAEPLTMGMVGVYPAYKGWCSESGYHSLARGRFIAELQRVCPGLRIGEAYVGQRGQGRRKILRIQGLRLLQEG